MVTESTMRRVLGAFRPGDQVDLPEIMSRSGLSRIAYEAVRLLVARGDLVIVRADSTRTKKKNVYSMSGSGSPEPF